MDDDEKTFFANPFLENSWATVLLQGMGFYFEKGDVVGKENNYGKIIRKYIHLTKIDVFFFKKKDNSSKDRVNFIQVLNE